MITLSAIQTDFIGLPRLCRDYTGNPQLEK